MDYTIPNLAIEAICLVILFTLLFYQYLNKDNHSEMNKAFNIVLISHIITITVDTISWIIDLQHGILFYYLSIVFNFLSLVLPGIDFTLLIFYILKCIATNKKTEKRILAISSLISFGLFVTGIINIFTNIFFTIQRDNVFIAGEYYIYVYIFAALQFVLIFSVILYYKKDLGLKKTITLLSYTIIPIIVTIINYFFLYLMLWYSALTVSILLIFINIQIEQEKTLKQQELELLEYKTAIMLSQIQPHFLYNSLSAISQLCVNNSEAHVALVTFSEYLRGNMDSLTQKKMVSFHKEMEHVKQYLWLEKLRFNNKLSIEYDIMPTTLLIPVLSLQPIVENAVRHGVTKKATGGTVKIKAFETLTHLVIEVSDDGIGFDMNQNLSDGRNHIGINNVTERLSIMCNGTLNIQSTPNLGTTATIKIPKK